MTNIPPRAEKRPHTITAHGTEWQDPYFWLRADNWQEVMRDPAKLPSDIRSYLEAENDYSRAFFQPHTELQTQLFEEMKGRMEERERTAPMKDGDYYYYSRYEIGKQYRIYCRNHGPNTDEEILYDANQASEGFSFFDVAAVEHSPDHQKIAITVDTKGSEFYTLMVKDLATGQLLADRIDSLSGDIAWNNDSTSLEYIRLDDNHRPTHVMYHKLGTNPDQDQVIYHETDPGFFLGIGESLSGRFIFISAHDHTTSEVQFIDRDQPLLPAKMIAARETGIEYSVQHRGDEFFISTNAGGAIDFKLVTAPVANPGKENWQDWLPHEAGRLLVDFTVFTDYLVRLERQAGLPNIVVHNFKNGTNQTVDMPDPAYDLGLSGSYEYATPEMRFVYSSPRTPKQTIDFNMATGDRTIVKEQQVPSGHDPENYIVERLQIPSHDGVEVPVTLLYHRDTQLSAQTPLLLYGYGSYGITISARFRTNQLSLVDRGFVYAVAHIRGGQMNGYNWYLDGKLMKKKNTFLDFIAAAEGLIAKGYTGKGQIVAHGGSAGGMLVGAVANMRPDLYRGIIASVPFVDVINTILDASLPLTPPEWLEWGNPIKSSEAFHYMRSYSPYDNIKDQAYPHMLVTAGLTDPRVTYWEPAKFVAKLRDHQTGAQTILLHTIMDAGHSGSSGRFDALKEVAQDYAFALAIQD